MCTFSAYLTGILRVRNVSQSLMFSRVLLGLSKKDQEEEEEEEEEGRRRGKEGRKEGRTERKDRVSVPAKTAPAVPFSGSASVPEPS